MDFVFFHFCHPGPRSVADTYLVFSKFLLKKIFGLKVEALEMRLPDFYFVLFNF